MTEYNHSIVIFSGGQDSTTVLGVALDASHKVTCVSFIYGQRHAIEIEAAKTIIQELNESDPEAEPINHIIIDLSAIFGNMISSALINEDISTSASHEYLPGLPASFVPARNALFITTAFGLAMEHHADAIYTGVCQTDYSGYPDCREVFVEALTHALNTGYEQDIPIITPLMHLNKAETFELATEHGVDDLVIDYSVTCYEGNRTMHEWGMGCDICPACELRHKGWIEYKNSFEG